MGRFHVYAKLFLAAGDDGERHRVFADAVEWIEHASQATLEKGLKTRIFAILCTREGADFLRWVTGHDDGKSGNS